MCIMGKMSNIVMKKFGKRAKGKARCNPRFREQRGKAPLLGCTRLKAKAGGCAARPKEEELLERQP